MRVEEEGKAGWKEERVRKGGRESEGRNSSFVLHLHIKIKPSLRL